MVDQTKWKAAFNREISMSLEFFFFSDCFPLEYLECQIGTQLEDPLKMECTMHYWLRGSKGFEKYKKWTKVNTLPCP